LKPGLLGLGSRAKVCETPPGIREVELFLGNSHNQGCVDNKNSVPKREMPNRADTSSTIPLDSPLGII
jgi:hypothetical protein